jgi:hypothetical protein
MCKLTLAVLCAVGLALGLAGAAQAATIDILDSLVPEGLVVGNSFHLVFVTSTRRDALSTDIADYNAFVNTAANSGGSVVARLGLTTWKAIGSTSTVNANVNALISAPVYRLDKVQVATDYTDMWNGTIANPINLSEAGNPINGCPWTGTQSDGSAHPDYPLGYVGGSEWDGARYGDTGKTEAGWINSGSYHSDYYNALYALSEPLTITPEPATLALLGLGGLGMLLGRKRR